MVYCVWHALRGVQQWCVCLEVVASAGATSRDAVSCHVVGGEHEFWDAAVTPVLFNAGHHAVCFIGNPCAPPSPSDGPTRLEWRG